MAPSADKGGFGSITELNRAEFPEEGQVRNLVELEGDRRISFLVAHLADLPATRMCLHSDAYCYLLQKNHLHDNLKSN